MERLFEYALIPAAVPVWIFYYGLRFMAYVESSKDS